MKTKFNDIKKLSVPNMVDGIKCCLENSNELFDSAILLKKNRVHSVSLSLLILSIEELMKGLALFSLMTSEEEEKEIFRDIFESNDLHSSRHNFALFFNEFLKSVDLNEIEKINENQNAENISNALTQKINFKAVFINVDYEKNTFKNWFSHANANKNKGLYVAYNKKWFSPKRITKNEFNIALKETELIRTIIKSILDTTIKAELQDVYNYFEDLKKIKKHFISTNSNLTDYQ